MSSQQKITALCLLGLSAAFDTTDHSILVHRASIPLHGLALKGTVLSWLQSHFSSRNFIVNINATLSALFPLHQGVPQGSVVCLFVCLFINVRSA